MDAFELWVTELFHFMVYIIFKNHNVFYFQNLFYCYAYSVFPRLTVVWKIKETWIHLKLWFRNETVLIIQRRFQLEHLIIRKLTFLSTKNVTFVLNYSWFVEETFFFLYNPLSKNSKYDDNRTNKLQSLKFVFCCCFSLLLFLNIFFLFTKLGLSCEHNPFKWS